MNIRETTGSGRPVPVVSLMKDEGNLDMRTETHPMGRVVWAKGFEKANIAGRLEHSMNRITVEGYFEKG
jgi:hypothetical protein